MFGSLDVMKQEEPRVVPATEEFLIGSLLQNAGPVEPQDRPVTRFGMIPVCLPKPVKGLPMVRESQDKKCYQICIHDEIPFRQDVAADIVNILLSATPDTTIEFLLSSPGGSLDAGAQIAAAMAVTKANTKTTAIGWCCSAAALIWTYGKEKHIEPGGYVMFHLASYGDGGHSEDIRRRATECVAHVKEVAIFPLVAQGILTQEEVDSLIEKRIDVSIDAKTFADRMQKFKEASHAA